MKIGRLGCEFIGAKVRQPHWGDCYATVLDVGQRYMIGQVFSESLQQVVAMDLFPIEEDSWELYVDAKLVISLIPVRKGDER